MEAKESTDPPKSPGAAGSRLMKRELPSQSPSTSTSDLSADATPEVKKKAILKEEKDEREAILKEEEDKSKAALASVSQYVKL